MSKENNISLNVYRYPQQGDLNNTYCALRNVMDIEGNLIDFDTDEIKVDLNHPLNIECEPSYDGTVNIIINDDKNPPRIINSRFTKLEDGKFEIINRNQLSQTNIYNKGQIDAQTRLFRNIKKFPKIDLISITKSGILCGGNYTFYIKLADNDYNQTDVVAESGTVCVFKGDSTKISSISGTVLNERTDKAITLKISNLDTSFSKIYVYYVRETCDQNGVSITNVEMLESPYEITDQDMEITIDGYESVKTLSEEDLNIQYNIVEAVKTQAQVQNMLFFGNVQESELKVRTLQNLSYFIKVALCQESDSIGFVSELYKQKDSDDIKQSEYYEPLNIYYKLGYWPNDLYRLGIVYIKNDDSLTPVFNLYGCEFDKLDDRNISDNNIYDSEGQIKDLPRDQFLTSGKFLDNTFGVFKNPKVQIIDYQQTTVKPLYYKFEISSAIQHELKKCGIKGFFIVRQKRIPITLCQGISVGVDQYSHIPMLYDNAAKKFFTESFLGVLNHKNWLGNDYDPHIRYTSHTGNYGIVSLDAILSKELQSAFDGSDYMIEPVFNDVGNLNVCDDSNRHYNLNFNTPVSSNFIFQSGIVFVDTNTTLRFINGCKYSTKCGVAADPMEVGFFESYDDSEKATNLLRGLYCPFLGVTGTLKENDLYNIMIPGYSRSYLKDYFLVRYRDKSPYFAISDRIALKDNESIELDVYRGDCFTNTVTVRINRNFVDPEMPIANKILEPKTWADNYPGQVGTNSSADKKNNDTTKDGTLINRADVNAVQLGMWITYKCLSNYNLGLRSIDKSNTTEYALMGSPRSFYPNTEINLDSTNKVDESSLLNRGYSISLGKRRNYIVPNQPYIKDIFSNRVMFSNVQREDSFKNAYRIFQGLSFKDIDSQYGAIVKLIPWKTNLLCVFEHGIGILPINEKALIQTQTGQSIHMYGAGVLQNQITLISDKFGSIWQESIIKTPLGVYGVDTYAKKIWRFTNNGFETFSDMKVQSFLNEHVKLSETDKYPIISLKNVKTHYNDFKGDILFTFYNDSKDEVWNLCFNERMNKWITRYSWTPLYSENINNIFYSLDRTKAKILGYIYNNQNCNLGIRTISPDPTNPDIYPNQWVIPENDPENSEFNVFLDLVGFENPTPLSFRIDAVETSYVDNNNIEHFVTEGLKNLFDINEILPTGSDDVTYRLHARYGNLKNYFDNLYIDVPVYFKLNINAVYKNNNQTAYKDIVGIVLDNKYLEEHKKDVYNKQIKLFLRNGFYVHGKAGIFDELDYYDDNDNNQILPTKWYGKQEPFEYEFVVNDNVGLHKIFDNLIIVSNNVQPEEIEFEIVGDTYKFNKSQIYKNSDTWDRTKATPRVIIPENPGREIDPKDQPTSKYKGDITAPRIMSGEYKLDQELINASVKKDYTLNTYSLVMNQKCRNIEEFGRRLGNIQYKEDAWYVTIDPLYYKERYNINGTSSEEYGSTKAVRLRDKFIKIRVKYTGQDLVIVTALNTIYTQSFS